MICPRNGCGEKIVRVERYHVTVLWELDPASGEWTLTTYDDGTHFHLFCAAHVRHEESGCGGRSCAPKAEHVDHETKVWGRDMPAELRSVIFPGDLSQAAL